LLPVVYGSSVVNLNLREFAPAEEELYYEGLGSRYRFVLPSYGFVGRDLEILKIEKGLLRHNVLLLRGMGGTGKTTLLCYLREWWQTTNFADDVFYFGYDERAWTLAQILFAIGQRIYDKFENARFVAMSVAAQVQKLKEKLRSTNYIVVLDNLESVTGQQLAIQNTLNATEQGELRDFLALLVGGRSRVVLGSRSGEEWLQGVFRQNVYVLRGLDLEARSELAEVILQRQVAVGSASLTNQRIKEIKEDADFGRLMGLLAGYPLAMEVVLANLRRQSPGEVLAALRLADVGLDGVGQDKTTSILKCVEYSHSNLSESAQQLLLCLAPFSGFIWRDGISLYAEELKKLEPFKDYDFAEFDDAIQEAINWGLLSPINDGNEKLLSIQPIFPYFLQMRLNQLTAEIQTALQDGFKNHYRGLAISYDQLIESKDPQKKQWGILFCRLEYENIYAALQTCLEKYGIFYDIYRCLYFYFRAISDKQGMLKIAEKVNEALEKYPVELVQNELREEAMLALGCLANACLETRQFDRAKQSYEKKLEIIAALQSIDARQKGLFVSSAYHQLGMVAQGLRDWGDARYNYQQALAISMEFGDLHSQAATYNNLGIVAQELRDWDDAHYNYQQALAISVEFGDRYLQAATYHELGIVAQGLRNWDDARYNHYKALAIFVEFGEQYLQAVAYHELGTVAQGLRNWDDAHYNYHQALATFVELGDLHSQAATYHELGIVAHELKDWDAARHNYQQALSIKIKFDDRYSQASTYHELGLVAHELREWDDARYNYHQALAIKVEFGDLHSQAGTYHELGMVAQELREWDTALHNYHQALAIFMEFGDLHSQINTYNNLGIVAQELREWDAARHNYHQALAIFMEFGDQFSQAKTYGQLGLLAENEGDLEAATKNLLQALQIFADFQDQHSISMTIRNLGLIYQSSQNPELITAVVEILGVSELEVQQIFDSMDQGT
jgi:tetratricopeptide (TPR) repeat protein